MRIGKGATRRPPLGLVLIDQTPRRSLTSRSNDAGLFFRYGSFSLRIDYGLCNRVETGTLLVNLMLANRWSLRSLGYDQVMSPLYASRRPRKI